jgi:hypothetical protein
MKLHNTHGISFPQVITASNFKFRLGISLLEKYKYKAFCQLIAIVSINQSINPMPELQQNNPLSNEGII